MIGWFARHHEEKVFKMLREHAQLTMTTADEFVKTLKDVTEEKLDEVEKRHRVIAMTEKEADVLRRRIIDELARSELSSKDRGDFMRLARRVDWVADWIHESSRILMALLPMINRIYRLSEPLKKLSMKLAEMLHKSTGYLLSSVEKLIEHSLENSLKLADEVERVEEEIDDAYEEARKEILKLDGDEVSTGGIVIFNQFLDAMENAADNSEHACDQIRVIAVGISTRPR